MFTQLTLLAIQWQRLGTIACLHLMVQRSTALSFKGTTGVPHTVYMYQRGEPVILPNYATRQTTSVSPALQFSANKIFLKNM